MKIKSESEENEFAPAKMFLFNKWPSTTKNSSVLSRWKDILYLEQKGDWAFCLTGFHKVSPQIWRGLEDSVAADAFRLKKLKNYILGYFQTFLASDKKNHSTF